MKTGNINMFMKDTSGFYTYLGVPPFTDNQGNIIEEVKPKVVNTVISEKTSDKMMKVAESVVRDGGGNKAYIEGMRVGGKTGTAQKVIDGKYAQGKYICSFVGIAPVDDPQIVVLAIVDEPNGVPAYGGTTAAPIVKEILNDTLPYLGVKPSYSEEEKDKLKETERVTVPDVRDLTLDAASKVLSESGLDVLLDSDIEVEESSKVESMFPNPGVDVKKNSKIMLYFEK